MDNKCFNDYYDKETCPKNCPFIHECNSDYNKSKKDFKNKPKKNKNKKNNKYSE